MDRLSFPSSALKPVLFLSFFISILAAATASKAVAEPTSIFILDASGSMWGRLPDKQTKIAVAKKVLSAAVKKLPPNVSAGLIVYGHRRKGDCSDIEILQKPKKGSGSDIVEKIESLSPRGRTPITDALRLSSKQLVGNEDQTTIVLVSDGIETCKGDPCALAETMAKSNAKLNIHVVGYGVNAKAQAQLQCIAEKGRGKYFPANDTSGLTKALATVSKSIRDAKPIEVEAPVVDSTTTNIKIEATGPGTLRLKLAPWAKMPKYWKVVNPETGEVIEKTNERELSLLPGQYQISWRQIEHGAEEVLLPQVVEIKSGKVTEIPVTTGLQLVPPKGMKRPYYWQLLAHEDDIKKWHTKRSPAAYYWVWDAVPVPAGKYTLVLRQSEHDHEETYFKNVELKSGSLTRIPLDQGINVSWPKSWGKIHYLKIINAQGVAMKVDAAGPVVLAPGNYNVKLRLKEHSYIEADFGYVTVTQKGFVDAKLTSGIAFDTKIKGKFYLYAVNLDTGKEASMYSKWGPMPLGAGRYRFDLKLEGQKRQTIVPEMTIKAGQFITAKM